MAPNLHQLYLMTVAYHRHLTFLITDTRFSKKVNIEHILEHFINASLINNSDCELPIFHHGTDDLRLFYNARQAIL